MNPQRTFRTNRSFGSVEWAMAMAAIAGVVFAVQSSAATHYVSQDSANPTPPYSTWDTAAHDIQPAVDAASDGDSVLVAGGEYPLSSQVTIDKAILLQSVMGAGQTTLNAHHRTRCLWMSNSVAVVDGFTLTGGYEGNGSDLAGGVVMFGGTLTNCIVDNVFPKGRLIYCGNEGLITDCQIGPSRGETDKGAGVYLTDSQLRNSTISRIRGPFYGVHLACAGVYAVSSTISGCTITGNFVERAGGGAYLDGCEMDRCVIAGNTAGFSFGPAGLGGGIFATNSVILDSLISGNRASPGSNPDTGTDGGLPSFGGGLYLRESHVLNCTVTGNQALTGYSQASQGGGIYVESGNVWNSIVYFNSASSDSNWFGPGSGSFHYSCTTPNPGPAPLGNIVEDPQFVDPVNGNYRLAPTSPCIDAGFSQAWMDGAHDLDGNPRIYNGLVDMGAYEDQAP